MSPELACVLPAGAVLAAAAHRAGFCTVKARAEMMTSDRGQADRACGRIPRIACESDICRAGI